jgi:hypothetical protein
LPTQVSLLMLTLTRGPVSLAAMLVNPNRICWQLGPGGQATVIFFIFAADADAWACHIFLNKTCFPEL